MRNAAESELFSPRGRVDLSTSIPQGSRVTIRESVPDLRKDGEHDIEHDLEKGAAGPTIGDVLEHADLPDKVTSIKVRKRRGLRVKKTTVFVTVNPNPEDFGSDGEVRLTQPSGDKLRRKYRPGDKLVGTHIPAFNPRVLRGI